jgi:hypothetical protein
MVVRGVLKGLLFGPRRGYDADAHPGRLYRYYISQMAMKHPIARSAGSRPLRSSGLCSIRSASAHPKRPKGVPVERRPAYIRFCLSGRMQNQSGLFSASIPNL